MGHTMGHTQKQSETRYGAHEKNIGAHYGAHYGAHSGAHSGAHRNMLRGTLWGTLRGTREKTVLGHTCEHSSGAASGAAPGRVAHTIGPILVAVSVSLHRNQIFLRGPNTFTRNIARDDRCDLQWYYRENGPGRLALPGPCAFQSRRAVPSMGCPGDPRAASNAKECFCNHVLELPSYKLPNAMCT